MINIERTSVMNLDNAIRGARNPMNSWARMDSYYSDNGDFVVGENDLSLMIRLSVAGTDHRKFLRQIFVSVDLTAPLYWWKEFDTYKVGTVANSCSTMHKIHAKEFSLEDFSYDRLDEESTEMLKSIVSFLEIQRGKYLETKDLKYWHNMIQLLPTSFNQMRTVSLNYENLISMYFSRKNHKLAEWHTLCDWILSLPYTKEIIDAIKAKKGTESEH